MTFGDLTQRPFQGSISEQAERLSKEAVKTKKNRWLESGTRHGFLHLLFLPTGRVKVNWRDRGGIKEGWFSHDWTIRTTLRKMKDLLNS